MDHKIPNPSMFNIPFQSNDFNGMPYRVLGRSGLKVSDVGLGTWKMGYPETGDGARIDEKSSFEIFDRAIELGVTFWDTANRYNNASGNSERLIGSWLNNNPDQRRNVVVATKLFGGMDGISPNHSGLSRANIMESVYASLERLQSDHIDLLYFHSHDSVTPYEESLMAIEDLVKQDLIRYFSVSNYNVEQLRAYQSLEKELSSRCRVLAVQNQFDVLAGETENYKGVLEYAASSGLSFIAWSPMAKGLLTEKYLNPQSAGPGDRLFDEGGMNDRINDAVLRKLQKLADVAHGIDLELSQLVIAYMLALPGMGPVIPSSSNVKQLESNAAAGKVKLTEDVKLKIADILS